MGSTRVRVAPKVTYNLAPARVGGNNWIRSRGSPARRESYPRTICKPVSYTQPSSSIKHSSTPQDPECGRTDTTPTRRANAVPLARPSRSTPLSNILTPVSDIKGLPYLLRQGELLRLREPQKWILRPIWGLGGRARCPLIITPNPYMYIYVGW